jgi:hypothetical protein
MQMGSRGEHPGAHNPESRFAMSRCIIFESRLEQLECCFCMPYVFSILFRGAWGARRFYGSLSALRVLYVVLYSGAQSVGRWLVGWLVPRHFCTCGRDQRRTLVVYINSYTMMPVFICPNTRTAYFYMRSLGCCTAMHTSCESYTGAYNRFWLLQFTKEHHAIFMRAQLRNHLYWKV